jgi:hypothetical protein
LPTDPLRNISALLCGALIVPEQRRADYLFGAIEKY